MEIILKNGENLILEVSPLLLEYLEEYPGGIEQLKKDSNGQKDKNGYTKRMYATNQIIYAIVASNYNEVLTYRQAVRLVKLEDIERILTFVIDNVPTLNSVEMVSNHRM